MEDAAAGSGIPHHSDAQALEIAFEPISAQPMDEASRICFLHRVPNVDGARVRNHLRRDGHTRGIESAIDAKADRGAADNVTRFAHQLTGARAEASPPTLTRRQG